MIWFASFFVRYSSYEEFVMLLSVFLYYEIPSFVLKIEILTPILSLREHHFIYYFYSMNKLCVLLGTIWPMLVFCKLLRIVNIIVVIIQNITHLQ